MGKTLSIRPILGLHLDRGSPFGLVEPKAHAVLLVKGAGVEPARDEVLVPLAPSRLIFSIFISEWHYGTNWPCVVLSRVKTINGVHFKLKLSDDMRHYQIPAGLVQFLNRIKDKEPDYPVLEDYEEIVTHAFRGN